MVTSLVGKALWHRREKAALVALSLTLAAALVSAFFNLLGGMEEKWKRETKAYGANLILVPEETQIWEVAPGQGLKEADLIRLNDIADGQGLLYAPFLYTLAELNREQVAVAGIWPEETRKIQPWWQVEGQWISDRASLDQAMVGINLASRLKLARGQHLTVTSRGRSYTYTIMGVVSTGGSEDNQLILSLKGAQELSHRSGRVSLVAIRAETRGEKLAQLVGKLEGALPEARVRTVHQVVEGERKILGKMELLLGLVAGVVLLCSALGVTATVTGSLLERTREIGLMKALGASSGTVAGLFLLEMLALALLAGLLGYGSGLLVAWLTVQRVFGSGLVLAWWPLVITLACTLGLALGPSLLAVRRTALIDPAPVLRGE